MENGIIYFLVHRFIRIIYWINLVEYFKMFGLWLNPRQNDDVSRNKYSRTSVDIFILIKWLTVILLFKYNCNNNWCTILVWYLLVANVFTYFYYHIWDENSINKDDHKIDKVRRQFTLLLSSIFFSNFCFAYLYRLPYCNDFTWSASKPQFIKSLWFSISNSLATNYSEVIVNTDFGNNVVMIQLIITFVFIAIILGKSVPQTTSPI